jgi:hypothetical protein
MDHLLPEPLIAKIEQWQPMILDPQELIKLVEKIMDSPNRHKGFVKLTEVTDFFKMEKMRALTMNGLLRYFDVYVVSDEDKPPIKMKKISFTEKEKEPYVFKLNLLYVIPKGFNVDLLKFKE